jgi:FtsP/CotA-like multicopper oxidase with cupredoxin domain
MKLTRRQLLARIGIGTGTTLLGGATVAVLGLPSANAGESEQLLLEPPELPIRRLEPDLIETTLVASVAPVRVSGLNIQALTYNGSLPGPTLRVREGDHVRLKFENRLAIMQRSSMPMDMQHSPHATNLHTHGLHISPNVDDPFTQVEPGQARVHEFTIPKGSAGTYWYHPHPHGHVAAQQFSGLYGAIIVEGALEREPEFHDADTYLLVFSDLSVNFGRVDGHSIFDLLGKQGNLLLVNGQHQPRLEARASTLRLRLVNASVARPFKLQLEHHVMHLIATDGGFLEKPIELETLFLAPGERGEVMVQLQAGTYRLLRLPYDRGGFFSDLRGGAGIEETLLTLIAPESSQASPIPKQLVTLERLVPNASTVKRKIEFGMDFPLVFTLNEKLFDMNRVDIKTKLNTLEVWEISNTTTLDHPFHLHTYPFQILERQIAGVWKPEPYVAWKDVVNLRGNERVRIAVRFSDFMGKTVYHCHVAEHEDRGMMGILEVSD